MSIDLKSIKKKSSLIVILALIILCLVIYWPVQNYDFLSYDDSLYVTDNYRTKSGFTWDNVTSTFTDVPSEGLWHPLTMFSHMLDWSLYGDNAGGHHWTSVIIHILNTVLLFLFFKVITGAVWRSAFVAALFAVHPINVESVAWIAERKNVLSTFFWILTMLFYVWYVRSPDWKRYLAVFISFALGLMSKPMLVTLPFVLLLLDYWPLNRTNINAEGENYIESSNLNLKKQKISFLIVEKVPLFVLSAISCGFALYVGNAINSLGSLDDISLTKRITNAIFSYLIYLKNLFWPTELAFYYPYFDISIWQLLIAILAILLVSISIYKHYRRYPYLMVGWLWYLGTMVPVLGIVQVTSNAMADRYAYIPFIGLFVMLVWGMGDIFKKIFSTKVIAVIMGLILFVLIVLTHYQLQSWENNYTLYNHAIRMAKPNFLPYKNLGLHLIDKNRPEEAAYYLYKAIELRRNDPTLHNSLGVALTMMKKYAEAEKEYNTALTLNPTHARAHNNLGMVLMWQGKIDGAMQHFQEAVKLQPQFANAHYQLSKILRQKGLTREADDHYEKAIQINPGLKNKE